MEDNEINETLSIEQRRKRAQVMRAHHTKIERAREIAQRKLAAEKNIRKRAFQLARSVLRKKLAGERGAEYAKLGPSEKISIDRMLDGKANAIKKLALRLMPKVKKAEYERLQSYLHGHSIQNMGAEEGHTMKEEVNDLFEAAFTFPQDPNRPNLSGSPNSTMNSQLGKPSVAKTGGKSKNSSIKMYKPFGEGKVDKITEAIDRKADQSGIEFDVLAEVFSRGLDAWTEDCKVNQVQYAFARVNSYINQGKTYFDEDADLHEMGGDQHYGDSKGATSGGAKGTPISKKKMDKDASETLNQMFQKSVMKKEEVELDEAGSKYNIPMSRPTKKAPTRTFTSVLDEVDVPAKHLDRARNVWNKTKDVDAVKKFVDTVKEETELDEAATVRLTKKFIRRAHDVEGGQTYGNMPYSFHPKKVASIGKKVFGKNFTSDTKKVALLHDVIEDTPYTAEHLKSKGYPDHVVNAVKLLSKDKSLSYEGNINRIIKSGNKHAMMVKYADNMANYTGDKSGWHPDKVKSSQKKYWNSLNALGSALGVDHHKKLAPPMNEEVESIHELSPATLDSYVKGSHKQAVSLVRQIGDINKKKYTNRTNAQPLNKLSPEDEDQKTRLRAKLAQRQRGQSMAADKMKTEENEVVEACWKKYKQVGTKLKNGRRVPNCVPEQVEPEVQHKNTKKRKGIENVDRNTNDRTELGKQTEIIRKIIEQTGNKTTAVQGKKIKEDIEPTDSDYHAKVHQDLQWHAGRNRGRSMGAANYHHLMSLDDQSHLENHYEKTVLPILKKHGYPTPPEGPADSGNQKYHAAVQEIIKNWENEPRVDESTKTGNKVNDPKKRLQGTNSLDKAYRSDTPGEEMNESFNIAFAAGVGVTLTSADLGMKIQGGFALHPSVIDQIEENAVTADREPVIIPAHTDAYGNRLPAKVVLRRTRRKILDTGNTHDGEPN